MSDLLALGHSSTLVAISSAVATSWVNPFTVDKRVRVVADVAMHVRVVTGNDEATSDDFPLFAHQEVTLAIAADEHLSFIGYVEASGTKESGTVEFLAPAQTHAGTPDKVTVNDGVLSAVIFTFGDGTGGTILPGATAAASAENLRAAIQAKIDSDLLSVSVQRFGATLQIVNDNYSGGTLSDSGKSNGTDTDVATRITLVNFSGGASPGSPPLHTGQAWVTQVL